MKEQHKNATLQNCEQEKVQTKMNKSRSRYVWLNCTKKTKKVTENPSKPQRRQGVAFQKESIYMNANKFSLLQDDEVQENDEAETEENILPQLNNRRKMKKKCLLNVSKKHVFSNDFCVVTLPKSNIFGFRCKGCFQNHFPNAKFCRKQKMHNIDREHQKSFLQTFLNRKTRTSKKLRGGAESREKAIPKMIKQAIESAKKHGISLSPGVRNRADGNCAFESVIYNINNRPCFSEKLPLHPDEYRKIWITNLEQEAKKNPTLIPGFSNDEMRNNWAELKRSGTYNIPFFGDLLITGIARGCKKNILIFNTSIDAWDPIYVVQGSEFGGSVDSDIPVVLAYNQVHYESLHPVRSEDIEKTKELMFCYINGNYGFQKKDIAYLISATDESQESILETNTKNQIEGKITKKTSNSIDSKKRRTNINVRNMTPEERRKYRRDLYKQNREKKALVFLLLPIQKYRLPIKIRQMRSNIKK